jgi:hypothetical protein
LYTILLNETNQLTVSVKERIMQRSKLVDTLHFLVDPVYKGIDMSEFTVTMEYVLPVSREYKTEYLVKSSDLYKDKLEYTLPLDTCLTKEAGNIEVQLTFVKVELNSDGTSVQRVRKTSPTTITILPISAWSDIIADSALSALDQRLIQVDAMLNAVNEMNMYLDDTKADNLIFDKETNTIQLTANGTPIGDVVEYASCGIKSFDVDENDNITITLLDGRVIDLGNIEGASGATFIPHIDDDKILTWTNDKNLPNPDPVDLNPFDEWSTVPEEGIETEYEWEFI